MNTTVTYTQARANLATLFDRVADDRELVVVNRRGKEAIALIALDELSSLLETAHLLRSPRNAQRLFTALQRARERTLEPQTIDELRADIGLTVDE